MKKYLQFIKEKINNFNLNNFLNENKNKFIVPLNEDIFNDILENKCSDRKIKLYRGDRNLTEDYYLINTNNIKHNYGYKSFMYILEEFVSSPLWDKIGIVKNKSIDFTKDLNTVSMYSNSDGSGIYEVIPFDNSLCVQLPIVFGNFKTKNFIEEEYKINFLSTLISDIIPKEWSGKIDNENVDEYIKKLSILIDNFNNEKNNPNINYDLILKIKDNMRKKNMNFIDYMNWMFSPENYNIVDISNINTSFNTFFTNGNVLLKKVKNENEIEKNDGMLFGLNKTSYKDEIENQTILQKRIDYLNSGEMTEQQKEKYKRKFGL